MSSPLTGTGGNRNKFPFTIVPVSTTTENTDSRTITVLSNNNCGRGPQNRNGINDGSPNPVLVLPPPPTPNSYHHPQEYHSHRKQENCSNVNANVSSNRSAAATIQIQKQSNAQFSTNSSAVSPASANGYQTLLQTIAAAAAHQVQVRDPAKNLYPNRSVTTMPPEKSPPTPKGQKLRPQQLKSRPIPESPSCPKPNQSPSWEALQTIKKLERKVTVPLGESQSRVNIGDGPSKPTQTPKYPETAPPLQYQVDSLAKQLQAKDADISMLKNELNIVKKSLENSSSTSTVAVCKTLTKGLAKVEKQLEDLEEKVDFYDADVSRKCQSLQRKISLTSLNSEKSYDHCTSALWLPDFDKIIRTTRELNTLVGHDTIELCYNSGGATFKQSQAITLTLYKNGIMLEDTPKIFKSFASPSTIQFLQDIYEGFFPAELQNKYPGGVNLIVDDKRLVVYSKEGTSFAGKGEKLSEPYRKQVIPKFVPGMKYQPIKTSNPPSIATSQESLLSSSSTKSESYEVLPDLIPSHLRSFQSKKLRNMVVLKLKNMVTGELYKFRTSIGVMIQNILDHLEEHLIDRCYDEIESDESFEKHFQNQHGQRKKFELVNILPFGAFEILGATLNDYGITTNTLLYFRPV